MKMTEYCYITCIHDYVSYIVISAFLQIYPINLSVHLDEKQMLNGLSKLNLNLNLRAVDYLIKNFLRYKIDS